MNILERAQAPTPKFFKILRAVGLSLAGIGGVLLTAPIPIPEILNLIGGYLTLGGGILSAVSQVTVDDRELKIHSLKDD
ncbi:hypothetical protein [Moheibacter stercoris]|uniref:Holin n=1 Tax=Moheibacter stercoris TaxID=1628251 RepID=A0ABV2LPQ6_9FLAO